MSRSPEPWQSYGNYIVDAKRASVCDPSSIESEDIERIVACVNFCRQFDTEWLSAGQLVVCTNHETGQQYLARLLAQDRVSGKMTPQGETP